MDLTEDFLIAYMKANGLFTFEDGQLEAIRTEGGRVILKERDKNNGYDYVNHEFILLDVVAWAFFNLKGAR